MILYIYNKETKELFETVEASAYDENHVYTDDSQTMHFGDEYEYSSKEDLSETLRAKYVDQHPTLEELVYIFLGQTT